MATRFFLIGDETTRTIIMATRFFLIGDDLYKRSYEGRYLKRVTDEEGKYVLKEIHEGC